jgi:TRAP-type mannitol/chloroaromatic compound transport system substrate-binding protein
MSGRRRFIATAGGTMAGVAAGAIVDAPHVIAQPKVQWRLSTAYPPVLDQLLNAARLTSPRALTTSSWLGEAAAG